MMSQASRGQPSQGRFAEARASLVESQLRPEGVIDAALLGAMGSLARERFVSEGLAAIAYSDRAVPLARGRALMPPAGSGGRVSAIVFELRRAQKAAIH